jgi:phytoene dehydrogenase-like protein
MGLGTPKTGFDVVIVGAGPNGLTAAARLARSGLSVAVFEAAQEPGGGCRSEALTLPGFVHDVCAAVHPMGALSPAFAELDLARTGLEWIWPEVPLAHPLNHEAAVLLRSLDATAEGLGEDAASWREIFEPLAGADFVQSLLQPIWRQDRATLVRKLRFGPLALRSAEAFARSRFSTPAARALFAGCAAHSVLALDRTGTASFGLALVLAAHAVGWPVARGGSQAIVRALVTRLQEAGGTLITGRRISTLAELPPARAVMFDLNPAQVAAIAGEELPQRYRARLREFPHGPGIFKVDWALSGPIPWRAEACRRALTVHVGGTLEEIARSEHAMANGDVPQDPYVLLAQQSLVDPTRAPSGRQTGWAYCHVPNGCTVDMTAKIEAQIERFAPGFRDCILARHTINAAQLEAHNAAMVGGDIGGGANDLWHFLFRPMPQLDPYAMPNPRFYLCSSSTPPGGGVHGMCGWQAAGSVLRRTFGRQAEKWRRERDSNPR